MTKKHFIAIAALFRDERPNDKRTSELQYDRLLEGIIKIALEDNPRFDRGRFLKACGGFAAD
jgi:hypothetical protein